MDGPGLKIIYITGWLRSGSTIVGNVLGEVPGFFHAGELHFLWKNAAGRGVNQLCGCGQVLTECPLWASVLPAGRPAARSLRAHADAVIARQQDSVRTRHTWRVLRRGLSPPAAREHAAQLRLTYQAIAERTGARVIVDSGKMPAEAALLAHLDGITPYYIHLVRDPRAVAQSYRQAKQYVQEMAAGRSTAYWHGFNRACAAVTRRYPDRSLFLRYEDFIAAPGDAVDAILARCGEDRSANPVRGHAVELRPNHTVTGNPDRFLTGNTVIRATDDSWRAALPARARMTARALSWPLFPRYGYR